MCINATFTSHIEFGLLSLGSFLKSRESQHLSQTIAHLHPLHLFLYRESNSHEDWSYNSVMRTDSILLWSCSNNSSSKLFNRSTVWSNLKGFRPLTIKDTSLFMGFELDAFRAPLREYHCRVQEKLNKCWLYRDQWNLKGK